uniref:NADH-ubiquinone oxidoreductase chain 6 n=2 Tax=Gasterophilus TaxID=84524 RepID=A0A4V1DC62_9MUSC|nr:NADH dehydrogenase subunit 6 [Gasterophilus haemorrhoidalis]YP_009653379.1 NADH dehydrogenase subunit 6 [Gasterophilus inermis]QCG71498.1 NADH dehydrogenase subunit 6 [Gasterophilus haemorrhoidalis]QCG71512.1 NADH dehydrogenase subunit 6 [Gasterophilus inermis]
MVQWILSTSLLIFGFIFMNMNHPLAMGLVLLIQTFLTCLLTGMISKTFWFSYILFLVFLGGMLVLFIYVTSLASNEMFSFSSKLMISTIAILSLSVLLMLIFNNNLLLTYFPNMEMTHISNLTSYLTENALSLNKLYNYPTNLLTILLMNYLLVTLIAVVKITKLFKGPLRPTFN